MSQPTIVIWGAGRIGRGFAADLFEDAGYRITFVDTSEYLVTSLRNQGYYTVVRAESPQQRDDRIIQEYTCLSTGQTEAVITAITDTDALAVCVFPRDFAAVAEALASGLVRRRRSTSWRPAGYHFIHQPGTCWTVVSRASSKGPAF